MNEHTSSQFQFKLFGRFQAWNAGKPVTPEEWGRPKSLQLLKMLLTHRGHVFTQDQLIDELFSDLDVTKANNNLQGRISELRYALEPDLNRGTESKYIIRVQQGYYFDSDVSVNIDVEEFRESLEQAENHLKSDRFERAIECFQQALECYKADLLEEDVYEDWSIEVRSELKNLFLQAVEGHAECLALFGRFESAVDAIEQALIADPCRENAYRKKMIYEFLSGNSNNAIQTYERCEKELSEQLGVEPSQNISNLKQMIKSGSLKGIEDTYPKPLSIDLLKRVPIFSMLQDDQLQKIIDVSFETTYDQGHFIVRKGSFGETFYLILDGQVEIHLEQSKVMRGRGQFFGEMALFDNWPRSADVIAAVPTRCLQVRQEDLFELIESEPKIAVYLIRELARRLRETDMSYDMNNS